MDVLSYHVARPSSVELRPRLSLTSIWPEGMQRLDHEQVIQRLSMEYSALIEYCWDCLPGVSWAGFMVVKHERTGRDLLVFRVEYDDLRHSQEAALYGDDDPQGLVLQVVENWGFPRTLREPASTRGPRRRSR